MTRREFIKTSGLGILALIVYLIVLEDLRMSPPVSHECD